MKQSLIHAFYVWERDMKLWIRQKWMMFMSTASPILYLLIFSVAMSKFLGTLDLADYGRIAYLDFVAAGFIVMGMFTSALLGSISVFLDRELGITKDLFTTPLSKEAFVFGKTLASTTKALIIGLLMFALAIALGAKPGSYITGGLLVVELIMISLIFAGFSISLTSFIRTQAAYNVLVNVLIAPLFLFSNVYYPLNALPQSIKLIAALNPLTYIIRLLRVTMLSNSPVASIVYGIAFLTLSSAVMTIVSAVVYRQSIVAGLS